MSVSRSRRQVRLSRALGIPLTPKAVRYFEKRPYGPGEHGRARRRAESDYAVRLKEKQRLRAQYGIREAQLQRVFQEARREKGLTGESLVELLEMPALPAPSPRPVRTLCTVTSWLTARSLTVLPSA